MKEIKFSTANHPDQWWADGGVIKFASAADAKAAERLFDALTADPQLNHAELVLGGTPLKTLLRKNLEHAKQFRADLEALFAAARAAGSGRTTPN
jgi:bacterioferritin (cytochrome b1)